jgi:cell wall-associated NlpC family hydrolase
MIDPYVGIPFEDRGESFDGSDCYGILRLIYKNELQIEIPSFLGSCYSTKMIFSDYLKQISECWELVGEPQPFDVVAMAHDPQHPRVVQHFGLYLGNNKMLHTLENIGSHIVDFNEMKYYVKGVYRWRTRSSNSTTPSIPMTAQ